MASKRRRQSRHAARGRNSVNIWLIAGAVVVLAAVVIFVSLGQSGQVVAGAYSEYPAAWINRNSLGNPDAAVTVQAWDDFL